MVFKDEIFVLGPYEAGVARYKHMYFNATDNMFKIWAITAVCTIVLYECVKNIVRLCLDKQIRYNMMLLFILSMFSHYYSWLVTCSSHRLLCLLAAKFWQCNIFKVVVCQLLERWFLFAMESSDILHHYWTIFHRNFVHNMRSQKRNK